LKDVKCISDICAIKQPLHNFLGTDKRVQLIVAHRRQQDKGIADRIKTILLLDKGLTYVDIAEVLFLDDSTLRRYYDTYMAKGLEGLLLCHYVGGLSFLSIEEQQGLDAHLTENLYQAAKEVMHHIASEYEVVYSVEGVRGLLGRLGFVFKKTKHLPGKGDVAQQKKFVEQYNEIKATKGKNDEIYFADAVHPLHNSIVSGGWIKKGKEKAIKANTGRNRLNINGACNAATGEVITHEDVCINAQSTIVLLSKLLQHQSKGKVIVIVDNARYYRCKLVTDYVQANSRLELIFLPPYSPNLNIIERLWKFYKKKILYNKYYETFEEFKKQTQDFFENIADYSTELKSLLRDNFYFPNQIYS
jgi:transposase